MSARINHKEIISYIFMQFDNEIDEVDIISNTKTRFPVDEGTIKWAIEMALTGRFRSGFIRAGKKYPKSNVDNDPFLKAAIQLTLNSR